MCEESWSVICAQGSADRRVHGRQLWDRRKEVRAWRWCPLRHCRRQRRTRRARHPQPRPKIPPTKNKIIERSGHQRAGRVVLCACRLSSGPGLWRLGRGMCPVAVQGAEKGDAMHRRKKAHRTGAFFRFWLVHRSLLSLCFRLRPCFTCQSGSPRPITSDRPRPLQQCSPERGMEQKREKEQGKTECSGRDAPLLLSAHHRDAARAHHILRASPKREPPSQLPIQERDASAVRTTYLVLGTDVPNRVLSHSRRPSSQERRRGDAKGGLGAGQEHRTKVASNPFISRPYTKLDWESNELQRTSAKVIWRSTEKIVLTLSSLAQRPFCMYVNSTAPADRLDVSMSGRWSMS